MARSGKRLPLEGIRVADFSWVAAAPKATRLLAILGAEVIKIESLARIDLTRGRPPFPEGKTGINVGAQFLNTNCDKLGITLNMANSRARDIARKLIKISDIVYDNFTPLVMEKWGLGYEELVKIKPDIIMVSMPTMGKSGPYRDYGGYGMGITAMAGINSLTGRPDRMPVGTGIAYSDVGPNPRHSLVAVLAALHYRNRTGKGQFIEIPQFESTICFTGTAILDFTVNKRIQTGMGNHIPYAAPHGAYRCKGTDRWCVIAIFTDADWAAFCDAIGNSTWTTDKRFSTLIARKENEEELDRLIEDWTIKRTPEEVMLLLQKVNLAAGVVETGEDLLVNDPQLRAREHYVQLDHPEAGRTTVDGVSFWLAGSPIKPRRPAPVLGQHNDYVYRELLGMSEDEIDEYIVDEVIY